MGQGGILLRANALALSAVRAVAVAPIAPLPVAACAVAPRPVAAPVPLLIGGIGKTRKGGARIGIHLNVGGRDNGSLQCCRTEKCGCH